MNTGTIELRDTDEDEAVRAIEPWLTSTGETLRYAKLPDGVKSVTLKRYPELGILFADGSTLNWPLERHRRPPA